MGSKSDVSAFFRLRFRNGLGTNLLGFCLFARASQTPFSWVWPGGLQASKSYVAHARPKHLFLEFGLVACRLPSLTLRKGLPCLRQPFFFVFSRFQKQRFGIFRRFQKQRFGSFPAAVSQWLGHTTCWGSAFSHARPKHLFLEFGLVACRLPSLTLRCALLEATFRNLFSLFLVGSKSNVSAVFWLRFRMVWALLLSFYFYSGFQKRRFGIFPAAVSQWLGHKTCSGSAFSHARPKHLFLEFGLVACRLFLCF